MSRNEVPKQKYYEEDDFEEDAMCPPQHIPWPILDEVQGSHNHTASNKHKRHHHHHKHDEHHKHEHERQSSRKRSKRQSRHRHIELDDNFAVAIEECVPLGGKGEINGWNSQNLVTEEEEIGIKHPVTSGGQLTVSPSRRPDVSPGAAAWDTGVHHPIEGRGRGQFPERIFPGAYREGGSDNEEQYDEDEFTIQSPIEPPIPPTVSAEPVNFEEEERRHQDNINRALQEALQRGCQRVQDQVNQALERELQRAVVAEVIPEVTPKRDKRWKFAGAFLLLVLIVVGVVLGITLRPDSGPTLLDLLSSVSYDGGEALRTPSTPQNRAFNWLAANSDLETYTNKRIVQRYALATLYFSTNGDSWMTKERWLDNGDECSWWRSSNPCQEDSECLWWQGSYDAVPCTDSGDVRNLQLNDNNLQGTIPPEIGLLSDSLGELGK